MISGHRRCRLGGRDPVVRRIRDSPEISVGVERGPDEKVRALAAQGQTVGHAARDAAAGGQITEEYGGPDGKSAGAAKTTALAADYQRDAFFGEGTHAVEAGNADRDLDSNAGAASNRFGCENFHVRAAGERNGSLLLTILTD